MPQGWTSDDIAIANLMAQQTFGSIIPKKGENVNAYEKTIIKSYMNIEYGSGASIDQLAAAYGYFGTVVDRIKAGGFEVPKDLQTAYDSCERDLKEKVRGDRLRQVRALELQLETLLTADEKRNKITAELEKLRELVK